VARILKRQENMVPTPAASITFHHATSRAVYGGVSGVSLDVGSGDVFAVLGGPGSGKTRIIDLVMGFRRPDQGSVQVLGLDPATSARAIRQQVAFVDGRGRLAGPMTPVENLQFLARLVTSASPHGTLVNALRTMGLPDRYLAEPIESLPTSAHVSVQLAIAWMRKTPVLVLDDPTTGFDSVATATFTEIHGEFRSAGVTVFFTTSDVLVAARSADHVAILKGGEKIAERRRHQLIQESLSALYADYVGRADAQRPRP
jgi:ABC-2 type transport system ATP-binding protein